MIRSASLAAALLALAACNGEAPAGPPAAEPTGAATPATGTAAPAVPPSRIPAAVTLSTNEPFWQAAVAGGTVTLTGVDSARRVLTVDADTVDGETRRISARDGAGSVIVEINDRACVNDMSGAPFPLSGRLMIDGRGPFPGCAAPPGYRPPAEPAANPPAAVATAIPARFVGLWAADAAGCRVPPALIDWLRVTAGGLRFHESLATVRALRPRGANAVELDLDFEGEGQQWQATRTLRLSGDVLTLSGPDMPPISRERCAGGDAAVVVPDAEKTPAAARGVVERYYAAIDRRDYGDAYALWSAGGKASGQSPAAFAAGFAQTARTRVRAGAPTNGEGAAGSLFIEVPVEVDATLADGTSQRFAGHYTLRRVNDVPGATAEQLRWRIASSTLKPVPPSR